LPVDSVHPVSLRNIWVGVSVGVIDSQAGSAHLPSSPEDSLLIQGVRPRLVMETLGHSEIAVTLNCYSQVLSELKREPVA
jgi:hypothetical protein